MEQEKGGRVVRLEWASRLKHLLICRVTIMLLAVLISCRRTLLSMPVWNVSTRLFCHRAAEEHLGGVCPLSFLARICFRCHNFKHSV